MKYNTLIIATFLGLSLDLIEPSQAIQNGKVLNAFYLQTRNEESESSSSSSSSSDTANVQLKDEEDHSNEYFAAGEDGMSPMGVDYIRVLPDQWNEESGNKFMTTIIKNFALEQKTKEGKPSGTFKMDKSQTKNAGAMLIQKYKKLEGKAMSDYMGQYFDRTWEHFDVNGEGFIDIADMPAFAKYLVSDQSINLDE